MKDIQADYEVLEEVARVFYRESDHLEEMRRRVMNCMEALEREGWWGLGAEAFYREMDLHVLPTLRRLIDALGSAGWTTRKSADIFADAEDEAGDFFEVRRR